MTGALQSFVRQRAANFCEYCHLSQAASDLAHPIDHIIARQHGGTTMADNLALCARCNAHKGPNIAGIDPIDGSIVQLYDPRRQPWREHFEWQGATLIGRSPEGRATILVLAINHPAALTLRTSLIAEGRFPPAEWADFHVGIK